MSQYKLIFTNIGLAKKQNAELNNDYIEITKFAVGSGVIATLVPSMTALIHEEHRADINNVDTKNGVTVFDLIIPSTVGGFYIKEVALFDVDGDCICIGTVPITYKVNQDEGASKSIHLKVSTTSTNTENIVFNTDDSLVYATVSYVNNSVNTLRNEMLLELPKKVNVLDVKNGLTFSDTDKPLSALQGKILKQYIDAINTMLLSDNSTLDNIQEIVDFIEMHQVTLNTLGIGNIAGLQNALNAKLGVNDTAANAAKLIGKNWNWSGQGGQPDWLWGGSDGANMYVYNPANFSVNHANWAENLTTPSGGYKHVGAWGNDSIGANGNILVNSAYRAERVMDLSNHIWGGGNANDFIRFPNGIVLQWGEVYLGNIPNDFFGTWTFPVALSNCIKAFITLTNTTGTQFDVSSAITGKYGNRVDFTVQEWSGVTQGLTANFFVICN